MPDKPVAGSEMYSQNDNLIQVPCPDSEEGKTYPKVSKLDGVREKKIKNKNADPVGSIYNAKYCRAPEATRYNKEELVCSCSSSVNVVMYNLYSTL